MEERKNFCTSSQQLRLIIVAIVMAAGSVIGNANLEQDKQECTTQLMGLAPCLTYVTGGSKAPTLDCCSGLKQVMDKSTKCLCLLIKDRDEPNLGIKVNISLAATLPNTCHSPANVSDCVNVLHLAPNSTDAKKFDGLDDLIAKGINGSSNTAAAGGGAGGGGASAAASAGGEDEKEKKSGGGEGKKEGWYWRRVVMVGIWGVMLTPILLI
ncbi:Non-specific lipid transfer protein GPI-anchored 6 [Linum perenne]